MRTIFTILVAVTLLVGLGVQQSNAASASTNAPLAGHYYRGDHLGYNINLDLLDDGTYTAEWRGCLGVYGTARGTWKVANDKVVFSPSEETDMMKGHLKELHIVKHEGQTVFVPNLQNEYYVKYGPDEFAAFHKQEKK